MPVMWMWACAINAKDSQNNTNVWLTSACTTEHYSYRKKRGDSIITLHLPDINGKTLYEQVYVKFVGITVVQIDQKLETIC